ncbi:hypothetical protein QTL95_05380 [Rhizobium sp. S152]|uniref:hypothetical protein n=1 Tax=Rhizobium sp. S152 TaxID=3055038 RepID=UPI0025A975AF|nr:hypothetical protein [Rhizobium sp. S152]MDM9625314.1 hypothetical protein [Rhizobium sp. S152]
MSSERKPFSPLRDAVIQLKLKYNKKLKTTMQPLFENDNQKCDLRVVFKGMPRPVSFHAIFAASACLINEHPIRKLEPDMKHLTTSIASIASVFVTAVVPLSAAQESSPKTDALVGRAWVETKPQSGLPGVMMVFLGDGTLLMDSCWETYALRKWTRTGPDAVSWDEDGAKVSAKIKSLTQSQLTLQVKAGKDVVEHRYARGRAPYVCPDMKR